MADDIDNEDLEGLDVSAEADAEDEDIDDGDFGGGDEFDGDDDVEFGGDDDDEEETPVVEERGEVAEGVKPKRADEQMCPSCFLLVRSNAPACPVGDDDCPILSA